MGTDRITMLRYAIRDIRAFLANDLRFLERSPAMRVPLSWLREYVDVDLDARGARRAPDPAGHGGQGHRAARRRLELGRRGRAARRSTAHPELRAGCSLTTRARGRRPADALDRVRRHEHRGRPARAGGAARRGAARRTGASRSRASRASRARGCSARAPSWASSDDADGHPHPAARTRPSASPLEDLVGDVVLDVDVKPNRGDALSIIGPRARGRGGDRRDAALAGHRRWPSPVTRPPTTSAVEVEDPPLLAVRGPLARRRDRRPVADRRPATPHRARASGPSATSWTPATT